MVAEIKKQIINSLKKEEQIIYEITVFNEIKKCNTFIFITTQRLFLWNNIVDNETIEYVDLSSLIDIKQDVNLNGTLRLTITFVSFPTLSFSFLRTDINSTNIINELKTYLKEVGIETKKTKHSKKKQILFSFITLCLFSFLTIALLFGGKFLEDKFSGPDKAVVIEQQKQAKKEAQKIIAATKNQINFNKGYVKRLSTYQGLMTSLNKTIKDLDISDNLTNWDKFKTDINAYSLQFEEIKISDEDMLDYKVTINNKTGYLQKETRKINSDITNILDLTKRHCESKFQDVAVLIEVREQGEKTLKDIESLNKKIGNENISLKKFIVKNTQVAKGGK
ncbi:MAG: hypothetical protein RSC93_07750 [Erysipelotrichaceae bacterium]